MDKRNSGGLRVARLHDEGKHVQRSGNRIRQELKQSAEEEEGKGELEEVVVTWMERVCDQNGESKGHRDSERCGIAVEEGYCVH